MLLDGAEKKIIEKCMHGNILALRSITGFQLEIFEIKTNSFKRAKLANLKINDLWKSEKSEK